MGYAAHAAYPAATTITFSRFGRPSCMMQRRCADPTPARFPTCCDHVDSPNFAFVLVAQRQGSDPPRSPPRMPPLRVPASATTIFAAHNRQINRCTSALPCDRQIGWKKEWRHGRPTHTRAVPLARAAFCTHVTGARFACASSLSLIQRLSATVCSKQTARAQ